MSPLRRGHGPVLAALLGLCPACSVLVADHLAESPGPSGRPPVAVHATVGGNQAFGTAALLRRIQDYLYDLSRDPTREAAVFDATFEIEDLCRGAGHPFAKCSYRYTPPADGAAWPPVVHVEFLVEEGPLVTVQMSLSGNLAHPTAELLTLWSRRRLGALQLGGTAFVAADVHTFAEQLRTFYRAHGRLDARVAAPQIAIDAVTAVATVTIAIHEGDVHTIRSFEVAPDLRAALGEALPAFAVGEAFTDAAANDRRNAVRNALRHLGHPDPTVEIVAAVDAADPTAWHLRVDGAPGPVGTIATVAVAGNEKTLDGIVLGKLTLGPGDRYDGAAVDAAVLRLHRQGLFRKVAIVETPHADDPTALDLTVQVEENPSRALELLAGYGSYEQLRGGVRLEERNLFGTGRGITFDNRLSMKGHATALTVADNDFLGSSSTLTLSGEYFRREEPSFTDEAAGGTLAIAHDLAAGLTARVGYTYRDHTAARAFTTLPRDQLVDFVEGKVFFELRNDRRDNLLFPQSGHTEFLAFERLAPMFGASVELDRLALRAAVHIPLWPSVQLVLRSEQSALWPHEGSALVPLQERWFSGGERSVRSYREAQLGPQDDEGRPVGGEYANLFGAELRFPLWASLEGGVFADAGNVGSDVSAFSFDAMGYGLGVGLRLLLPIGPVRLDTAWNPDPMPGDRDHVIHLSVGYAF